MLTETPRADPSRTVLHLPRYCSESHSFVYDVDEETLAIWKSDRRARAIFLDSVIVCPMCDSLPTVRCGCAQCGSAMYTRQSLMHHYACAHVAPRRKFQFGDGVHCPKCGHRDLVHGRDCEFIEGSCECQDCRLQFDTPELIGHCLSCEHRFAVADGRQMSLFAWEVSSFSSLPRRTRSAKESGAAGETTLARSAFS